VSKTLPRRLQDLEISPETVLLRAGLPASLFNQEKILLSTEELFSLHRGIAETCRNPALTLKLGTDERVEHYDPNKIAALSARTFRDSIRRLGRYKQITCPEEISLIDHGSESIIQFLWLLANEQEPPVLVDICFAWVVALGQRGTGEPIRAKRVEFKRSPASKNVYEKHFQCPVKFNCKHNALVFSKADMDRPFITYNPDLLAVVAPQLEAELSEQLAHKNFAEQAKGILKQMLAGRRPAVQDLAKELRLSTRTLQRRLAEQGFSFQHLLDEARQELAHHYLLHSSRELNETAYLLGYEDANSFYRAFQQWEGTSPGQWRLKQQSEQSALALRSD
jgi:AraC-like DNA-binding protein